MRAGHAHVRAREAHGPVRCGESLAMTSRLQSVDVARGVTMVMCVVCHLAPVRRSPSEGLHVQGRCRGVNVHAITPSLPRGRACAG
jgi:hypothetical protein